MWTKFRDALPPAPGFVVLKYREGQELPCWMDPGDHNHWGGVVSYPVTVVNDRYDVPHDLGEYVWVNSWHIYGPTEWREMAYSEAREYHRMLYRFARSSPRHPDGRVGELP